MRKITSWAVLLVFLVSCIMPPNGFAQMIEGVGLMPEPGTIVRTSPAFVPAHLVGVMIDARDPLKFDFLIRKGEATVTADEKNVEYRKLIKYFLAAMTIPDSDQWVNLSPYENDRIIQENFGMTEMGRDLLAQDYLLKQLTASLIHPDTDLGRTFWERVYQRAQAEFGTTDIPLNAFNKVWITPDKATVWEKGNTAYVIESHLKVLTEQDYVSLQKNSNSSVFGTDQASSQEVNEVARLSGDIVRDILIPEIEKEVNEGKNFAPLRQIVSSMVLATWYKRALKESLLGELYADRAKVKGVDQDPRNNTMIYDQYVEAFKKGVVNLIKEDMDQFSQEIIPRKYFSGGFEQDLAQVTRYVSDPSLAASLMDAAQRSEIDRAMVALNNAGAAADVPVFDEELFNGRESASVLETTKKIFYRIVQNLPGNMPIREKERIAAWTFGGALTGALGIPGRLIDRSVAARGQLDDFFSGNLVLGDAAPDAINTVKDLYTYMWFYVINILGNTGRTVNEMTEATVRSAIKNTIIEVNKETVPVRFEADQERWKRLTDRLAERYRNELANETNPVYRGRPIENAIKALPDDGRDKAFLLENLRHLKVVEARSDGAPARIAWVYSGGEFTSAQRDFAQQSLVENLMIQAGRMLANLKAKSGEKYTNPTVPYDGRTAYELLRLTFEHMVNMVRASDGAIKDRQRQMAQATHGLYLEAAAAIPGYAPVSFSSLTDFAQIAPVNEEAAGVRNAALNPQEVLRQVLDAGPNRWVSVAQPAAGEVVIQRGLSGAAEMDSYQGDGVQEALRILRGEENTNKRSFSIASGKASLDQLTYDVTDQYTGPLAMRFAVQENMLDRNGLSDEHVFATGVGRENIVQVGLFGNRTDPLGWARAYLQMVEENGTAFTPGSVGERFYKEVLNIESRKVLEDTEFGKRIVNADEIGRMYRDLFADSRFREAEQPVVPLREAEAQADKAMKGGIDLNAANLNMQIKRDGNGVVLPMNQQNLENIRIDGLIPEILSIVPATTLPMLSEAAGSSGASV